MPLYHYISDHKYLARDSQTLSIYSMAHKPQGILISSKTLEIKINNC